MKKPYGKLVPPPKFTEAELEREWYLTLDGSYGTKITDESLKDVAKLQQLKWLKLINTQVTDEGLKEVAKLQQLETLDLGETKVTEAGVAELKKALPDCNIEGP